MALKRTAEYYKLTDACNNQGTYYKVYHNGLYDTVLCFMGKTWVRSQACLNELLTTTDCVNVFGQRIERSFRRVV